MRCGCYECVKNDLLLLMSTIIVCGTCGNKRCPHATNHLLPCTNSNEPGQLGSRYGTWPHPDLPFYEFISKGQKDKI